MSTRTTVTLDDDVLARLKEASASRGVPFKEMLNEAIRSGLTTLSAPRPSKTYKIKPFDMGECFAPSIDNISELIAFGEGEDWR